MTNWTKTKNLKYLIDPTFSKVNKLFGLSFQNEMIEHISLNFIRLLLK